jgi:hypothetical protein
VKKAIEIFNGLKVGDVPIEASELENKKERK